MAEMTSRVAPEAALAGDDESMHVWLRDGDVLCELIHRLVPGNLLVSPPRRASPPHKKEAPVSPALVHARRMVAVGSYLDACRALRVPEHDLFNSIELVEGKNMRSVPKVSKILMGREHIWSRNLEWRQRTYM